MTSPKKKLKVNCVYLVDADIGYVRDAIKLEATGLFMRLLFIEIMEFGLSNSTNWKYAWSSLVFDGLGEDDISWPGLSLIFADVLVLSSTNETRYQRHEYV